jgi:D-serine deaminase-like pyridoxal phosphate-dependent protein
MSAWYEIENADEIPSPALLVYPDRIRANLQQMIRWAGADRLRPHVKTHKMPKIVQMKLDAGITKFKTSTIAEAEMTAAAGGRDVLLAYQPVGPNVTRLMNLARAYRQTVFSTLVDDAAVAEVLAEAARRSDLVVDVYVDLNVGMDRTGVRPGEGAAELYRVVSSIHGLRAAGLHAYDGHIHDCDESVVRAQTEQAFAPVWKLKHDLEAAGLSVPNVIGCGTASSKMMASEHGIEVGAGTSVLWDAGQPGFTPPMRIENAAILLARVVSRPTDHDLCIDLGHKAVASEMQPPRVQFIGLPEATSVMHNEEHLVLRTSAAGDYPVGSILYGIPTHICPTVALYDAVWCVQDHRAVETWPVVARTRRITI